MTVYNKRLSLITIYGPNKDDTSFYINLFKNVNEIGNDTYVICGDFNISLDPTMACYNYKHINNPKARKYVLDMINENNHLGNFIHI